MATKKRTVIYFVTFPDGRLVEGSQTSISEDIAIAKVVRHWLPENLFPGIDYGGRYGGGVLWYLWPAMEKAGFKVHEIEVPTDGVSY